MIIGLFLLLLLTLMAIAYFGYGWPYIGRINRWSIGIYTGKSPLKVSAAKEIDNPVLTAKDVTDLDARFVADPFMVKEDSTWYMFFEVLHSKKYHGDIGLATSQDGFNWQYQHIVLSESFHLSYPYVFNWENQYYMIPESSQSNTVRLYKAVKFPSQWELDTVLLSGKYSDSTVFYYNEKWWMFSSSNPRCTLHLFYADHFRGPWIEHPKSPLIYKNPHIARPAGRVVIYNNRIIRYTQDVWFVYGNKVRGFEITKLTTEDYQEKKLRHNPILKRSGKGWNRTGMHHIDLHQIDAEEWISCVDGFGF
jgi:hypothetical protein